MLKRKQIPWSALAIVLLLVAVSGLLWTPHDPMAQEFRDRALEGPSAAHLLGIDGLGRDFASRLWKGSGHTVILAALSTVLTFFLSALLVGLEQSAPS